MDLGTLNHAHRCFICGDTHLPLERYQYYSYEGRTVLLCYFCAGMQRIQKKEVEIVEEKLICWRCGKWLSANSQLKAGLCEECRDLLLEIRRVVMIILLGVLWVSGLVYCTTLSVVFVGLYLLATLFAVCLFGVYESGWFGWINYLVEEYRKGKLK